MHRVFPLFVRIVLAFGFLLCSTQPLWGEELRVASWNILADCNVRQEYYPNHDIAEMTWEYRGERVLQRLLELQASVIALQEVEPAVYSEIYTFLEPYGYEGVYAKKGRGKGEGSAIFFKRSVGDFLGASVLFYDDNCAGNFSGNVALSVRLRIGEQRLGFVTTHILYSHGRPGAEEIGIRQVQQLLDWVARQYDVDEWVVTGDFNGTAESPKLQQMVEAGFIDAYETLPLATFSCPEPVRVDYLFHSSGLFLAPDEIPLLMEPRSLPSESEPSDHLPISASVEVAAHGHSQTRQPPLEGNLSKKI